MTEPMKCWCVSSKWGDASILVWEESVSKAKSFAMGSDWFCEEEWTDLRCKRVPQVDHMYTVRHRADGNTRADQEIMRNLGWYELEGYSGICEECGLHEWHMIPESVVNPHTELCAECAAKEATNDDD